MVLCFDPFVHSDNMYPSSSNRHNAAAASQNFTLGPYGFSSQQAASQYAAAAAAGVSDSMGCPVAQYQMSAAGLTGMSPEGLQQSPSSWHAPAAMHYTMSSCSRATHHVPFDEWPPSVQSQTSSPNSCAHVPSSAVGMPSSPLANSCHFAGHSYKLTNGPSSNGGGGGGSPATTATVVSAVTTAAAATISDYSGQVQVQDLTCGGTGGGHHSPDSGLTVSSDGVSSSGSPQLVIVPPTNHHHHVVHHGRHVPPPHPHHHHHPFHSQTQVMNRPTPVRSPFEWMKSKPNYQNSHPNPGNGRSKGLDALIPGDIGKTRTKDKYRVVYSDHQRLELEKEFHYSRYITIRRKAELAQMLGLSERQVKIWFQNRRAKERKQGKKRDELKIKDNSSSPMGGHHHHHHHVQGHLQPPPPNALMTTKVIHLD